MFRDRKMMGIIFIMPVLQTLVFGYAVTTDVRNITTAVYDLDNTVVSRELTARFVQSGYFKVIEYVSDERRIWELVDVVR